jgi:hypothetical protein
LGKVGLEGPVVHNAEHKYDQLAGKTALQLYQLGALSR